VNSFGLVYNKENYSIPDDNELKNLNLSYADYVISSSLDQHVKTFSIVGFTGNTINTINLTLRNFLHLKVTGNPFMTIASGSTNGEGIVDFHIKPNSIKFEEFRAQLKPYEKYIISDRDGTNGFRFIIKNPTLLDDGTISYSNTSLLWTTSDDYNIDVSNPKYQNFGKSTNHWGKI